MTKSKDKNMNCASPAHMKSMKVTSAKPLPIKKPTKGKKK
jgi:hypothetical protein